jgi:glycosyltransferase involved in cell wall biosynthesis
MKIAILFDNLGPYHLARLRAAASVIELLAVECFGRSADYAWTTSVEAEPFARNTLFPHVREVSASGFLTALSRSLADFGPDVVALPGWSGRGAFAGMQWCQRAVVPAVVMADSTAHDEPRVAWKEWIKRVYLRNCGAALAAGRLHADYLIQLGMSAECISVGYDAVDNAYFGAQTNCGEPPVSPYFLASARFLEKKNLPLLLRAYAQYRTLAKMTNIGPGEGIWKLIILGDGPLRPTLEDEIARLGLSGHTDLPGFVQYSGLPNYYANAGAFVHASTTEQWGLVVNEAMASGLPVLVSNRCGCAPDLVEEGVNGWTFDPTNEMQLAQLLLKVADRGFPRAEFGTASKRIVANWGPDRFAAGLKQAAEYALQVGAKRPGFLDRLVLSALLWR